MNILTAKEVKDRLRCGLTTVYALFDQGELRGFRLTNGKAKNGVRIFAESVDEFMVRRSNQTARTAPVAEAQAEPAEEKRPVGRPPKRGSNFADHVAVRRPA